jgi:GNAT superfamily N-acetyltransferase
MMKPEAILQLYDADERLNATMPGMQREVDGPVVRLMHEAEPEAHSFVIFSDLDENTADTAVARQRAYFQTLGRPVEWKLYAHDKPADLAARLAAGGFAAGEEDTILALELARAPQALLQSPAADVRRLEDVAKLKLVRAVLTEVHGRDFAWLVARMTRLMCAGAFASVYLAYVDGQPAATAWAFFPQGSRFASMWAGATLPAYRKRGLYTALVAARVQEALARGYQFMTIDAGPMSRPIVERYGFEVLARAQEFVFKPLDE